MFPLFASVELPQAVSQTASNIDLNNIAALSQGNPLMVVALGAVAMLGGKTLWDFLKKRQEMQHEQKLEELKVASTGHEQCVAKQEALETQVSSLKGKVNELENKAASVEKKSEETVKLNVEALDELDASLKKVKKKVKKLEEAVEETKSTRKTLN